MAAVWWEQQGVPERARQTWARQSVNVPALKGSEEAAHHPETAHGQDDPESGVLGKQRESPPGTEGVPIRLRLRVGVAAAGRAHSEPLMPVCLGLQNWAMHLNTSQVKLIMGPGRCPH